MSLCSHCLSHLSGDTGDTGLNSQREGVLLGLRSGGGRGAGGGSGERRTGGVQGAAGRQDAHHQTPPGGKVHVHLSGTQEVLPCGRRRNHRMSGLWSSNQNPDLVNLNVLLLFYSVASNLKLQNIKFI